MGMKKNNENLIQVLRLVQDMMALADQGLLVAEDDGCRLLYGVVQDCAYKIRRQARMEEKAHLAAGKWDGGMSQPMKNYQ